MGTRLAYSLAFKLWDDGSTSCGRRRDPEGAACPSPALEKADWAWTWET